MKFTSLVFLLASMSLVAAGGTRGKRQSPEDATSSPMLDVSAHHLQKRQSQDELPESTNPPALHFLYKRQSQDDLPDSTNPPALHSIHKRQSEGDVPDPRAQSSSHTMVKRQSDDDLPDPQQLPL